MKVKKTVEYGSAHQEALRNTEVKIKATNRHPSFDHSVGRINIIVGINGSGKTSLLKSIMGTGVLSHNDTRYLHERRYFRFVDQSTLGDALDPKAKTQRNIQELLSIAPTKLFQDDSIDIETMEAIIELLKKDDKKVFSDYETVYRDWNLKKLGPMPAKLDSQIDRISKAFNSIFPNIHINFDSKGRLITGNGYSPTQFSAGEQHAFLMLTKFSFDGDNNLYLIDEPEINLHPKLAHRVWYAIEQLLPNSRFIYATHSVQFALRDEVDRLFVIAGDKIVRIDNKGDFENYAYSNQELFVSAAPAVFDRSNLLLVEGEPNGAESRFYEYVLKDNNIGLRVESIGSCSSVQTAIRGEMSWRKIVDDDKIICGMIDRDFLSDDSIARLRSSTGSLEILPVHEFESILAHPTLILRLAEKVGFSAPTLDDLINFITERCNNEKLKAEVILRRVTERLQYFIPLSLTKRESQGLNLSDAKERLSEEYEKRLQELSQIDIKKEFDLEENRVNRALEERNIDEILVLFPGKLILESVKKYYHINRGESVSEIVNLIIANSIEFDIEPLCQVRALVLNMFNRKAQNPNE